MWPRFYSLSAVAQSNVCKVRNVGDIIRTVVACSHLLIINFKFEI